MKLFKRYPAGGFVILAFLMTYGAGIGGYLALSALQASLGTAIPNVNDSLMRFGPTLAGLMAAALVLGRIGVADLLRQLGRWRAPASVWLLSLGLPPALLLLNFWLLGYSAHRDEVAFVGLVGIYLVQLATAIVFAGLGEELGWRGFLLSTLSRRWAPLQASALTAIAWLVWHLPAYVLFGKGDDDPLLPFCVIVFPFSILMTWVMLRSGGSLLFPVLMHGSINASFYTLLELFPRVLSEEGFQPRFDWILAGLWIVASIPAVVGLARRPAGNPAAGDAA